MKTYSDLTLMARKLLMQEDIPGYQLEARLLVAHAAGKTLEELLRDSNLYTTEEVADRVRSDIQRRLDGEPVAYITGDWEFYGIPMHITKDVLIPRMDTEILVDAVRDLLTGRKMDARVLDLCTGSGCRSADRTRPHAASIPGSSACRRTRLLRRRSASGCSM